MTTRAGGALIALLLLPPCGAAVAGAVLGTLVYPVSLVLALATAVVAVWPLLVDLRRDAGDPYSPAAYTAWFFVIPAFATGGVLVAFGLGQPGLIELIPDPATTIAQTQLHLLVGVAAFGLAFVLPGPARLGRALATRLPADTWSAADVTLGVVPVLLAGMAFTVLAFKAGVIGYQRMGAPGDFGVAAFFLSQAWLLGAVMTWGVLLRGGSGWRVWAVVALLLLSIPLHVFLSGSRATPLNHVVAFGCAFAYSGRAIRARHVTAMVALMVTAVAAGMLMGSAFREQKALADTAPARPGAAQGENRVSTSEQAVLWERTWEAVADAGPQRNAAYVLRRVSDRLEHVMTASIIVGRRHELASEEARLGLRDNIWHWTWTGFIPRVVWPGKPIIGDSRSLGQLYLGVPTSPAITPMVDLLRNYGPLGVPVGMFLLGLVASTLHAALVGARRPALWCTVVYYALLMRLSFEGWYATFLPDGLRAAAVAILVCLVVEAIRRLRRAAGSVRVAATT